MQLLVIEDDLRLSDYLKEALGREGHFVDACASISEVDTYMSVQDNPSPQVVILDRMLGRDDGATLIKQLKSRYQGVGVLVLSSLDMPSEKAKIIDSGADEYLSKPFSLEELSARLRLVSRRNTTQSISQENYIQAVGNLGLNLKSQLGFVNSSKMDLTRKEFQTLVLLSEQPGRVFSRFQLLDRVWETERVGESNVVETLIKNLRRKLEEVGSTARIENRRNVGYWIEA